MHVQSICIQSSRILPKTIVKYVPEKEKILQEATPRPITVIF